MLLFKMVFHGSDLKSLQDEVGLEYLPANLGGTLGPADALAKVNITAYNTIVWIKYLNVTMLRCFVFISLQHNQNRKCFLVSDLKYVHTSPFCFSFCGVHLYIIFNYNLGASPQTPFTIRSKPPILNACRYIAKFISNTKTAPYVGNDRLVTYS